MTLIIASTCKYYHCCCCCYDNNSINNNNNKILIIMITIIIIIIIIIRRRRRIRRNLDGILQNDFHQKSSFDKTKHIFDQSIWECNGHFVHWFSNTHVLRLFVWNLWRKTLSFRFI